MGYVTPSRIMKKIWYRAHRSHDQQRQTEETMGYVRYVHPGGAKQDQPKVTKEIPKDEPKITKEVQKDEPKVTKEVNKKVQKRSVVPTLLLVICFLVVAYYVMRFHGRVRSTEVVSDAADLSNALCIKMGQLRACLVWTGNQWPRLHYNNF